MNITSLEISNVKRIKALTIHPDGSTVVIGGKNGQGKTSVLDSIVYALAGASKHCAQPVRQGEDKGRIVCTLENGLTVTRTFTAAGGTALAVTNGDGALLDDDSLALIAAVAAEADAQVWIERVGRGDECSVVIEDGQVSEDRSATAATVAA